MNRKNITHEQVFEALFETDGNVMQAGKLINLATQTIYERLNRFAKKNIGRTFTFQSGDTVYVEKKSPHIHHVNLKGCKIILLKNKEAKDENRNKK